MANEDIKKIIANNMKTYREHRGLQKKEVADFLGVSPSSVTHWEDGSNSIDINKLAKLCELFQIRLSDMINDADTVEPINQQHLTSREQMLLDDFRSLSEQGQDYILQTMDMVKDKYKKDNSYSILESA